jgi:hypothetical protein
MRRQLEERRKQKEQEEVKFLEFSSNFGQSDAFIERQEREDNMERNRLKEKQWMQEQLAIEKEKRFPTKFRRNLTIFRAKISVMKQYRDEEVRTWNNILIFIQENQDMNRRKSTDLNFAVTKDPKKI